MGDVKIMTAISSVKNLLSNAESVLSQHLFNWFNYCVLTVSSVMIISFNISNSCVFLFVDSETS